LKKKFTYCFFAIFFFLPSLTIAQYYIRGEVKDEKGNGLQNVRIILNSTGLPYSTGVGGAFGILTSKATDSLSLSVEGYEPFNTRVNSSKFVSIVMKMQPFAASLQKHSLLSITGNGG
jgi:Ca-activated chloride channel homolog